jgi:hypothetical protein
MPEFAEAKGNFLNVDANLMSRTLKTQIKNIIRVV